MISTHELSILRQQRPLLDQVSVSFKPGEVSAILGPNGAGKSTLLRCLAGSLQADQGKVTLNGRQLSSFSHGALARRRAVLSQHSPVNFSFRVMEVVLLGRNPHLTGHESPGDLAIAEAALQQVAAWHLREQDITTLSGGERQRVHLARVLAQVWESEQAILLLDEPTAALDLKHQHTVLEIARHWAREHSATVICVLHEPNLARYYADTALLLKAGRAVNMGPVEAVLDQDSLMQVFGLSLQMYQRHFPGPTQLPNFISQCQVTQNLKRMPNTAR